MIIEKIRKVTTRINEVLDIVNYYADQYKPLINTLEDYYNKVVREDQLREQIFLLKVKKYTLGITYNEKRRLDELKSSLLETYIIELK